MSFGIWTLFTQNIGFNGIAKQEADPTRYAEERQLLRFTAQKIMIKTLSKILLLFAPLFLIGCMEEKSNSIPPLNTTSNGLYSLETVIHDGHSFVVWGSGNRGEILHHPDCQCKNKND